LVQWLKAGARRSRARGLAAWVTREKQQKREREGVACARTKREREEDLCERQRAGERINELIKYYTILLQCALKNENAL